MKRLFFILLLLLSMMSLSAQETSLGREIGELARQINLWRINLGLGPLVYNETLERMAVYQADYLLREDVFPDDIHRGPQGMYPRERSQQPQFAWATYGHPELMSVTEIAAIGSIETAIDFWQNSDLHNRSVTNPTYREIGIAAYEYGDDILFIVVLGGQPNVVPALLDLESQQLYMNTEKVEWTGDWVGEVTEYRYLDADEQPISDWVEWDRIIDIPDEMIQQATYLQYIDADENRTTYELIFEPKWSSLELPEGLAQPTATPTEIVVIEATSDTVTDSSNSSVFATNTPIPSPTIIPSPIPTLTPFPTSTPTPTPLPKSLIFTYTDEVFVLRNNGAEPIDLSESRFRRDDIGFVGSFWEEVSPGLNIAALPPQQCLMIQPENNISYEAPSECIALRSIVQEPDPRYFWLGDFEMLIDGNVVATCSGDGGECAVVFE